MGGKHLEALRDWLRDLCEMERREEEGASSSTIHTGEPNYSGRLEMGKADPNGYMRTVVYNGENQEFSCIGVVGRKMPDPPSLDGRMYLMRKPV